MNSKPSVVQKEDSSVSFTVTTPDASNWGSTFKPLIWSTSFNWKYCLLCVVLGLGMELYWIRIILFKIFIYSRRRGHARRSAACSGAGPTEASLVTVWFFCCSNPCSTHCAEQLSCFLFCSHKCFPISVVKGPCPSHGRVASDTAARAVQHVPTVTVHYMFG